MADKQCTCPASKLMLERFRLHQFQLRETLPKYREKPHKLLPVGVTPTPATNVGSMELSYCRPERHRAKLEVAGAIPAVDAILPLCLRSHRASFVNSYTSVRVRPEAPFHGDHDVTAASRPVKAFVPVRIRLVTPIPNTQWRCS